MTDRAFHLSLNVADLPRSIAFYKALLGVEPAKSYADYAKFEMAEPALVLSLEPSRGQTNGGAINHLGIRVQDGQHIREYYERMAGSGVETQWIAGVECCYSRQSKIVTHDPDGNLVEVYVVEEDLERPSSAATQAAAPAPSAPQTSHTHMLGTPIELPLAARDAALEQVNLRGTFNAPAGFERRAELLAESARVLAAGGELTCHLLVADAPLTKPLPTLPAPAQYVTFAPTISDVLRSIEQAGFVDVEIVRLSHSPVMVFDEVGMRELLVSARKPVPAAGAKRVVVYKGPMRQLADDGGVVYRRGERVVVDAAAWERLQAGASAGVFAFLNEDDGAACRRD
jgi:catechol 2,3-dioxygenase-like lactoylglutathione lyase family enzyme